jgi:hypothetical protein
MHRDWILFLLKIIYIFYIFRSFLCADIKNDFLKKYIYYFDIFLNEKYFKLQSLSQPQTYPKVFHELQFLERIYINLPPSILEKNNS